MKVCTKCGVEQPVSQFYKRNGEPRSACKVCTNEQNRAWHKRNPEKQVQYDRKFAATKPEQAKARMERYRKANVEKIREAEKRYKKGRPRKRNREYDRAYARAWNAAHLERRRLTQHKYRVRKLEGAIGVVTLEESRRILSRPCIYCGAQAEHLDHVVPVSRGGAHSVGNLAPACADCNLSKRNRFVIEWKAWKRRDKRHYAALQNQA